MSFQSSLFFLSARSHDYGRQRADKYDDDYDDDYYSYDNSAAMSFSGFGGVSYNPNDDDDDDDEDYSTEDESSSENESESDEQEGNELAEGIEKLET